MATRLRDAMPTPAKRRAGLRQRIHTRGRARARYWLYNNLFENYA